MHIPLLLARTLAIIGFVAAQSVLAHGDDFTPLKPPQPTDSPGKIEVIEFFWYGCPHCNNLEPMVETWEKRLPKDVVLRREHVIWQGNPATETHARLFLTLRAMGLLAKHHNAVFAALHREPKSRLRSEAEIFDWAAKQGIDPAKFKMTFQSFGVNAQLSRARDLTEKYQVSGVPSLAVNGKYIASLGGSHSPEKLFEVVEKLIASERTKK